MIDLVIASSIGRDLVERQFAAPPARARRAPAAAPAPAPARAPIRRSAVRALRAAANRLEPAPQA